MANSPQSKKRARQHEACSGGSGAASVGGAAARDVEAGAGREAALLAGEVVHQGCDLLGLAGAADRLAEAYAEYLHDL